jgi:hypothetical protein
MNTNPYAPPIAVVADLADDGVPQRRSKIAVVVSVNAGLFAVILWIAVVSGPIKQRLAVIPTSRFAAIVCLAALLSAVSIGVFRQRRWAAILWCALCGLAAMFPLIAILLRNRTDYLPLGLLTIQFVVSLVGLWAIQRRRASSVKLQSLR